MGTANHHICFDCFDSSSDGSISTDSPTVNRNIIRLLTKTTECNSERTAKCNGGQERKNTAYWTHRAVFQFRRKQCCTNEDGDPRTTLNADCVMILGWNERCTKNDSPWLDGHGHSGRKCTEQRRGRINVDHIGVQKENRSKGSYTWEPFSRGADC